MNFNNCNLRLFFKRYNLVLHFFLISNIIFLYLSKSFELLCEFWRILFSDFSNVIVVLFLDLKYNFLVMNFRFNIFLFQIHRFFILEFEFPVIHFLKIAYAFYLSDLKFLEYFSIFFLLFKFLTANLIMLFLEKGYLLVKF